MKKTIEMQFIKTGAIITAFAGVLALSSPAVAAEQWQATFEEICGKVDSSSALSVKELSALIEKADKIAPEIQSSSDPSKKVYLRRLKNCRSMYEFMIETKKSEK